MSIELSQDKDKNRSGFQKVFKIFIDIVGGIRTSISDGDR